MIAVPADQYVAWLQNGHAPTVGGPWLQKHDHVLERLEWMKVWAAKQPEHFGSFLDIGCHDGRILTRIKDTFPLARVVGVELVPEAVNWAILHGHDVKEGDLHALPFQDQEFDWVFCLFTLRYTYDMNRAMGELKRVARRGILLGETTEPSSPEGCTAFPTAVGWLQLFGRDWALHHFQRVSKRNFYATFVRGQL